LSDEQLETLRELLSKGATAHGWHNDLWTSKRVAKVIRRHFKIKISQSRAWYILTHYLGWSVQNPIQQLRERDDAEIERWKKEDFPRILEDAERLGAYLVFVDESGFMLSPVLRRTFAPRGKTPVIKVANPHGRISAIGALIVSPVRKHLSFICHLLPDNANFRSGSVIQFVGEILARIHGPIIILWDSIPIHCSQSVVQHLEKHDRLIIEQFPAYASELNPVDKVWLYLKYDRLPNYVPTKLTKLRGRLLGEMKRLRHNQKVLSSCIRRTGLGRSIGC
jgi:transposase